MGNGAVTAPQRDKAEFGLRRTVSSSSHYMPKVKTTSTDRVRCSCGCGEFLSRRQQTRHQQGRGPVMAVAKVIEARAYFRERDTESPEPPQPRKRRRLQTPVLGDDSSQPPTQRGRGCTPLSDIEQRDPPPSPAPAPAPLPRDPAVSNAAREALSAPWAGPVGLRYDNDDGFESTSDTSREPTHPVPGPAELESSDMDSDTDTDGDGCGSSKPNMGDISDIFETNADLNTAEYSEYAIDSSH